MAMLALDLVPVAGAGGLVFFAGALGGAIEGGQVTAGGYLLGAGLIGASLAPILVDYRNGAIFRLNPGGDRGRLGVIGAPLRWRPRGPRPPRTTDAHTDR